MTRDGDNTITNMKDAFGHLSIHEIIHPDMCLVVDEVESNLSQKGDGHVGGRKVMSSFRLYLKLCMLISNMYVHS